MARLPYRGRDELPEEYRALFDHLEAERGFVPKLHAALANSPRMLGPFIAMTAVVREEGSLPARLKELAILTVAHTCDSATIRAAHYSLAHDAGVSDEQFEAIDRWRGSTCFDDEERAVMAYAEEVTRTAAAADTTWAAVEAIFGAEQLAELALVVAFYNMVARFLEPVRVDVDPRYGSR